MSSGSVQVFQSASVITPSRVQVYRTPAGHINDVCPLRWVSNSTCCDPAAVPVLSALARDEDEFARWLAAAYLQGLDSEAARRAGVE